VYNSKRDYLFAGEAASAAEGDLAELNRRLEVARSELESVQKSDRDKSKLTKEVKITLGPFVCSKIEVTSGGISNHLFQLNEKNAKITELEKKLKDSEERIKKTEALLNLKKERITKVEKEVLIDNRPDVQCFMVLSVQKVSSCAGRAGRLRLMGRYIDHRLVARSEPDNTFWDDITISPKAIVRFWSSNKAPFYGEIHWPPPCCTTRTGQYLLD